MCGRLRVCIVTAVMIATAGALWAQSTRSSESASGDAKVGSRKAEDKDAAKDKAEEAAQTPPRPLTGDIITFKNGKVLSSVQVLRSTPKSLVVQVRPGLDPIEFPQRQIQSVQYDNIDPTKQREAADEPAHTSPDIIVGEEFSAEFHRKLTVPITTDQPLSFDKADCIDVLRQLSDRVGVTLEIAQPAADLPPAQRTCSIKVEPQTSFLTFLKDEFAPAYPHLKVIYRYDKLELTVNEAAPPPAAPPPSPAPGPLAPAAGSPRPLDKT